MKVISVFSLVIVFHIVVLGVLLIQPGCQSQPSGEPEPSMTQPTTAPEPMESPELDPAFNAGITTPPPATNRQLSSPKRPETDYRAEPDMGGLEPVLEPVQDSYSLPAQTREVVVRSGDTLSAIAKREGVTLNELLSSNGLTRSSTIYVGQTLFVPTNAVVEDEVLASEVEHSGVTVEVRSGDTLSAIAARHGTSVRDLKAVNGLTSDTIFVGQELLLPESATKIQEPQRAPQASFATGMQTYVVESGDTPSSIARKFGISSRELMTANNITDPRKLYIGRNLVIPEQGTMQVQTTSTPPVQTQSLPPVPREPEVRQPTESMNTVVDPELEAMSTLEALEDEDLPYVEVEVIEEEQPPLN